MAGPPSNPMSRGGLATDDPVRASQDRLRARMAARTPTSGRASPAPPPASSGGGAAADNSPGGDTQHMPQAGDGPPAADRRGRALTPDMEEWGVAIKRQKTFTAESEAEWNTYCKVCYTHITPLNPHMYFVARVGRASAPDRHDVRTSIREPRPSQDTQAGSSADHRPHCKGEHDWRYVHARELTSRHVQVTMRRHSQLFVWSSGLTVYRGKRGQLAPLVLVCPCVCPSLRSLLTSFSSPPRTSCASSRSKVYQQSVRLDR
jgi:hypothetical protein